MLLNWTSPKFFCAVKKVHSLPNDTILDNIVQIESTCTCIHVSQIRIKDKVGFKKDRKDCGKGKQCWAPAFSPFPTMFSKGLLFKLVKTCCGAVKGYAIIDHSVTLDFINPLPHNAAF